MFIGIHAISNLSTGASTTDPTSGTGQPSQAGGSSSNSSPSSAGTSQMNAMLQPNQFLSLLVDSLKYQDPLNPTNSAQFLSQLAQLSQVETLQQLAQTDTTSSQASELANASSLVGKTVGGLDASKNPISGTVTAITDSSNGPVLVLGKAGQLPLSAVTSVS